MHQVLLKSSHRPREKRKFTSFVKRHILSTENETKTHTSSNVAHQRLNDLPMSKQMHLLCISKSQGSSQRELCNEQSQLKPWLTQVTSLCTKPQSHLLASSAASLTLQRGGSGNRDGGKSKQTKRTQKKILQQLLYTWGSFIYMYAYIWKTNNSNLFIFIYFAGSVSQTQRLMWHGIFEQKILHFHINQF